MLITKEDIFNFFPKDIFLKDFAKDKAEEIRVRVGQAVTVKVGNEEILSSKKVDEKFLLNLLESFSENSIYAVQSEINSGYITIKGGHRVGISGTCIFENEKIKNIRYISSLNIRIAHEIKGISDDLIDIIYPKNIFENTLIISSPGSGKTTLLRDMIRNLSIRGNNISVVDERAEIAATYKGNMQNDLGPRTDVMNNCKKDVGIKMMIRSMAPQIIATDEIGGEKDVETIYEAHFAGIKLLLTCHGDSIFDVPSRLYDSKLFKNIIILKKENVPGKIKNIYTLKEDEYAAIY